MKRPALSDREAGFALVETLVSAALLVVIAIALLTAAERAASTAGQSRARSAAAAIAEEEQERLRSMPVTALANYHPTARTVPAGGVDYTVTSRADWVRDSTGATQSCTNDSTQADYLRLTSTVTSNVVGTATKPVSVTSLVAPPVAAFNANQGTLAVMIKNAADKPVVGMNVSITGGASLSDATNDAGCAIFAYIPKGAYHVLLNTAGWVDPDNQTAVDFGATVVAGKVTLANHNYDRSAKVAVAYETVVSGTPAQSFGWGASAAVNDTGGAIFGFKATAPPQKAVDATSLYPQPKGYKFYAGECTGASPETPDTTWFTKTPGSGALLTPAPGSTNGTVTVRQPPVTLTVKNGAAAATDVHIVLTPQDAACAKLALTTDGSGRATKQTPDATFDPGVPFGKYGVCVDGLAGTTRKVWRSTTSPLDVKVAGGPNNVPTTPTAGVLDFASQGSVVNGTTIKAC